MSKLKTKNRTQINRRVKQYRGGNLPFWLEKPLNFIFKELFAILCFWVLYSLIEHPTTLLNRIGIIVLLSVFGNIIGLFLSWIVIMLIQKAARYPISGLTNLNSVSKAFDKRLAEVIKMLVSAILIGTGVLIVYRDGIGNTWQLLGFYALVSIASRIIAQLLSMYITKSAFAVLAFLIFFGMLITLGLSYLLSTWEVDLNGV